MEDEITNIRNYLNDSAVIVDSPTLLVITPSLSSDEINVLRDYLNDY